MSNHDTPYHGNLEAVTDSCESVLVGYDDILKGDSTRVRAALAHVDLLLPNTNSRAVGIDNKAGEGLKMSGRLGMRINGDRIITKIASNVYHAIPFLRVLSRPSWLEERTFTWSMYIVKQDGYDNSTSHSALA